ncbi:MAG: glycosyltransferase family 4 protein [Oligoflexia bacterium]|nr:glycosyltransferase family 4 protein [Oligoflexia bacterium]
MRILILSQFFDPELTLKGQAFAEALHSHGHQVEVLTAFPNYPGGRIFPGYRQALWRREMRNGIKITRVPLYPSHDRSALRRILSYLSFALSASFLGPLLTGPVDLIYVYHPPGTISFPALCLKLFKRARLVLDIQDLWPDSLAATGMVNSGLLTRIVGRWLSFFYRHTEALSVLSPGFKLKLAGRGVPPEKIHVIYNWCDERTFLNPPVHPLDKRALGVPEESFSVLFAGGLGLAQGLDTAVDAALKLRSTAPEIQLLFLGAGVDRDRLLHRVQTEGLSNVKFLPHVEVSEVPRYIAAADALLVHLKDNPLFHITVPSKTQAYMAAGKPILMGVRGDAEHLVLRSGAGLTFEPENAEALAQAILELASRTALERRQMGQRAQHFYREELSFQIGTGKFLELFELVAGRSVSSVEKSALKASG